MTNQNHTEETHLKLLDTYEQPEEFKRVLKEALALAEKLGAERERERIYKIGRERIKWHNDVKNQWAGVIHANTSINAIQSLLDDIIPPMHGQN